MTMMRLLVFALVALSSAVTGAPLDQHQNCEGWAEAGECEKVSKNCNFGRFTVIIIPRCVQPRVVKSVKSASSDQIGFGVFGPWR